MIHMRNLMMQEGENYYYCFDKDMIDMYTEAIEDEIAGDDEMNSEEEQRKIRKKERIKKATALTERAYQLREEFILNHNYTKDDLPIIADVVLKKFLY